MKATFLQQEFTDTLAPMRKFIGKKTSVMTVSVSNDKLQILILEKKSKATASAEINATILESGTAFKLPAMNFYNYISMLPKQELTLTVVADSVQIKHSGGETTIRL